jgi:hypothetical protein
MIATWMEPAGKHAQQVQLSYPQLSQLQFLHVHFYLQRSYVQHSYVPRSQRLCPWRLQPHYFVPADNRYSRFCLLIVVWTLLITAGSYSVPLQAQQCPLVAGAPNCGTAFDPGSNPAGHIAPQHAGNPIDVITGNKYQRVDDYQALGSRLRFSRHYNSALADYNLRLGQGWRHSYHVVLTRASETILHIVQSDGRKIVFQAEDVNVDNAIYKALDAEDGYVVGGDNRVWNLPDGRRFSFHGSFLVRIDFPDGDFLDMYYRNAALNSVTDSHGLQISIGYYPGGIELPRYDESSDVALGGHIREVKLPDGQKILYHYDSRRNFSAVGYADGVKQTYEYADPVYTSHLTGIGDGSGVLQKAWAYDEWGRGVRYEHVAAGKSMKFVYTEGMHADFVRTDRAGESAGSANTGGVNTGGASSDNGEVSRTNFYNPEGPEAGYTDVIRDDGFVVSYAWQRETARQRNQVVAIKEFACEGCAPDAMDWARQNRPLDLLVGGAGTDGPGGFDVGDRGRNQGERKGEGGNQYGVDSAQGEFGAQDATGLTRDGNDSLDASAADTDLDWQYQPGPGTLDGQMIIKDDGHEITAGIKSNRQGEVVDVTLGDTRLVELLKAWSAGEIAFCGSGVSEQASASEYRQQRLRAIDSGAAGSAAGACFEDLVMLLELKDTVERGQEGTESLELRNRSQRSSNRFCGLPGGRTCAEFQEDYEMAQLSACVYGSGACAPGWQVVPAASLPGIAQADFVQWPFASTLFYNPVRDVYVLAFRGTDDSEDWRENILQHAGIMTPQYEHAIQLATDIQRALPGRNLEFTGHSLGGGLATIAALGTAEPATIFKPAALHVNTGRGLNVAYENADQYVEVLAVDGDILTMALNTPQRPSYEDAPFEYEPNGWFPAPGAMTELPRPDPSWIRQEQAAASGIMAAQGAVLHGRAAVLESMQTVLINNCGVTP